MNKIVTDFLWRNFYGIGRDKFYY